MKHLTFFALLLSTIFFSGCGQKSQIVTYTGDGPGSISGKVALYDTLFDEFTNNPALLSDSSGVQVSLEGSSYSTTTNGHGEWELANVPSGAYSSLMYSKP